RAVFFLQAGDGIRDFHVTGVQTCALPIFTSAISWISTSKTGVAPVRVIVSEVDIQLIALVMTSSPALMPNIFKAMKIASVPLPRSEERRVGKECRKRLEEGQSRREGIAAG